MRLKTKPEHLPQVSQPIPLVQSDRGGQITYHGPGQIIIYALFDLRRLKLSVREAVRLLEQTVINLLLSLGISAIGDEACPAMRFDVKMPHARANTKVMLSKMEKEFPSLFTSLNAAFKNISVESFFEKEKFSL